MINKHPFVSIIIAHFNGKKMIKDCLDALYGIDYPKNKFEVIVVDNGSSDGSVKFIKNKYKKTTVFVNKINNYCKACNLGIEKSKGEYVVLLNNDVVVGKRWMAALVKVIKNDNSIGAVTSKLFSADTIQNAGLVGLPNFYWDERGAGKDIKEFNSIAEVDAVSGASVLYRRAALEQTGLLDEDFVIFGEDVDLSLRMKKQGWKLVYVPASTAYHKKHGSCDERFAQEAVEKNRLLLVAKHYPHKLPGALITSDYFIVRGEKQKVKSIFILLPEILSKLNKEHQGAIFNEVARDVFDELGRLINYESKKIEEELKDILNDLEETRKNRDHYKSEEDRYKKDIEDLAQRFKLIKDEIQSYQEKDTYLASQLQSFKEEMLVKDNQLIEKDNQLVEKDNQASSLSDQISALNQQIKQQLDSLAGKESLLAEKQTQLISYKDELNNLYAQLQRRMTEVLMKDTQLAEKDTQLAEKDTQLAEKDTQISSLSDQISVLNQQIKQQLDSLADKESLLTEKQGQLVVYKDELNNLSNQLQQRMEEVLLRSGELLESREEAGALKEELSRLAEELATKIIDIEENKIELTSYKDELNNLSNQLQQRMDEVLIKDGQLIEKDTQISSLSDQISALNQQIKQSLADKESLLTEKQGQLVAYKDELNNLSNQLQQRMEEVLMKDSQVIEKDTQLAEKDTQISSLSDQISALNQQIKQSLADKESLLTEKQGQLVAYKDELNNLSNQLQQRMDEIVHLRSELQGIYNSEGFKFVLRPLWTAICSARASFRLLKHSIRQLIWLTIAISLTPFFLFLSVSFLIENIFWGIFKPILSRIVTKRRLVPFEDLKISLVIPNWNGIDCLKECLPSVFSVKDFKEGTNEVLVVDDASTDGSVEYIKSNFPQVRLILNKKNKGFGFTCNRGVKQAKNELIVLINNDVVVTENFLEPLISHFREGDVFSVTPKMYGWDRKTFVWGMHMGHFENGYIRLWNESETGNGDRVSQHSPSIFAIGGGMVFRKKDFLWLGGFDSIYKPNCWEDIDISYRAWKRGLKVIYEPGSVIYHKGKATLTYERQKEIKNELLFTWKNITDSKILNNHLNLLPKTLYQNKNRVAFVKGFFWAFNFIPQAMLHRFLEKRFIVEQDSKIFNRIMLYYGNFVKRGFKHQQGTKPNVLVISRFFPFPLNVGGKIRIHTLTKLLSEKYNFHLLSLIDHYDEYQVIPELKKVFAEVYPVLAKSELNLDFFSRLFYPARYKAAYSYSQELIDRLIEIQKKEPIDIIQIESNELLYLLDYIKHIPVVYTEHDISFLASKKSYYRANNSLIVSLLDDLNRFHFHTSRFVKIDKVITLSKEDENVLRALFPRSDINLVPTGVDLEHFSFQDKPRNSKKLIYVGHYRHYPNEDAVVYFARKIFPLVRKKMSEAEFWIVGSSPTSAVKILAKEKGITVTGEVNDVKAYLDESSVFVNSNCVGAGIKGKVLEAMATGLPVVSTKVGSSGIDAKADEEILIADNPMAFANKVIKIITDNSLRERLITEARWLVERKYDWLKIIKTLDRLYQGLLWGNLLDGSNILEIDKVIDKTNKFVEKKIDCLKGCLMKPEDGPEELHIELTYNCNSKCIMCDLWDYEKRSPGRNRNELSLDEIKRLVDSSVHLQKTKTVVLSGGEPFLRKDIAELCGFFNRNLPSRSIGILTNAMATDTILDKSKEILDRFQPRSLWLGSSLDGIGKAHDRIRGIDGAFSTFYKTIGRCKKELPEVKLSTTFTLTPHNLDQLLPVKQFADREELDFFAQFVVPKEGREKFRWTADNLQTVKGEIKEIIQELLSKDDNIATGPIEKIKDKNLITQLYYWSNLVEYQAHPKRLFKRCITGSKFAMLSPYGDLFFCPILKNSSIGNIREEKFDNLWMSEKAQGMRKFIEEGNCHCWLVCIVFPILERALND